MAGVGKNRWRDAQEYEKGYWRGRSRDIREGGDQLDWYAWRARRLEDGLREVGRQDLTEGGAGVLEIGSGPVGVVSFLDSERLVAIDPLATFYATDPELIRRRSSSARYVTGKGEDLPFASEAFDLVIIENCIDHVQAVDSVVAEMARILRPGGMIYLTVNVRTSLGKWVHRVLSRTRIDQGHPHSFNVTDARSLLGDSFNVVTCGVGDYRTALLEDLRSPNPRTKLKAIAGVSEFLVTLFAERA